MLPRNWRLYWGILWLAVGVAMMLHHEWFYLAWALTPGVTFILWHADHWEQIDRARFDRIARDEYIAKLQRVNAAAENVIRELSARGGGLS